ncbi:Rap1-interacting factor 1 N terminal-domain-containing protein, partial [Plectosphaerella plurivora]
MLESAVKQLAGADRDAKLDAYMMIVRALQASKNLPDRIALRDKMTLFLHFIQRDIVAKNPAGTLDTPLIVKALSLLDTFLFFPAIASTIPSDFGVFIIDHCIKGFEDQNTPKELARRLLHVAATQDFTQRVWTTDRVRRLVAALHGIEGHLRGKSIVVYRLRVYHRLIQKAQPYMVTHTDWLNDVFTDMLSPLKDIRSSAIKLGSEAAFVYGRDQQLSRRVLELLDASIEEKTYIEWYREQLLTMTKSADKAVVPQIWSVIVLLIRVSLCRWRFFNPWLHLIQNCFNSSDVECNREANFAWNRFVYTLHFDDRNFSSTKMFSTLLQPIAVQLRKAGISDQKRELVFGGLCNLYYYAFKPNATLPQIDMYWDTSVKPLTDALVPAKKSSEEAIDEHFRRAAVILTSFFGGSKSPMWQEDRVKDTIVPRPQDLPMIDQKWIRRSSSKIFSVMTPIMDRHFCQLPDKTSPIYHMWNTLVTFVGHAASKEIKVSNDTADFISETLGLLLRYWQVGLPEGDSAMAEQFLLATQTVVLSVVEKLGVLPFTERMFSLGTANGFMPISTPSHKPGKNVGDVRTPLQHLFGLFTRLPPGIPDDETYLLFIRSVFSPFFTSSKSAKARSDLANEMLQSVPIWTPQSSHYPYGPWVFASENIMAAMSASQVSVPSSGDALLGHEYRVIVRLLERGWRETPNLPWARWQAHYHALVNWATEETGEAGRAVGVIEPLAKMIRGSLANDNFGVPRSTLKVTADLLSTATQPRDRQALDAARRRLWGTATAGGKVVSFDPFDHLYKLVDEILTSTYDASTEDSIDPDVSVLLTEVTSFLNRPSNQQAIKSISNLENGIAAWVQDKRGLMNSLRDAEQADAAKQLWSVVCKIIFAENTPQLETFEQLLCAGFESKHRHIVNIAALAWNTRFEGVEHLDYPDHLKAVLLSSQTFVDLTLPGLAAPPTPSDAQGRSFVESQEAPRDISLASSRSLRRSLPPSSAKSSKSASPAVAVAAKLSLSERKRPDRTPRKVRSSARSTPTSRLRHDNSQLQFVPVESSPLANQEESQNLTERQKEVRTRQKQTANIYPVRSSPRRKSQTPAAAAVAEKPTEQQQREHRDAAAAAEEAAAPQEVFVDALSSPPSSARLRRSSRRITEEANAKDSSFVMSDGDERSMLRLVVELDSRKSCELPLSDRPAESPPKRDPPNQVEDCITVAPSPKKQRVRKSKSRSPAAAVAEEAHEGEEAAPPPVVEKSSKKKRKRSGSSKLERRKKRKADDSADDSMVGSSQSSSPYLSEVEGDKSQTAVVDTVADANSSPQAEPEVEAETIEPPSPARSEGNTDTELESQLVAEQQAASLSQSQSQTSAEPAPVVLLADITEEMDVDLPAAEPSIPASTPTMMESLANVLTQLQSATLPRAEVHKMEDMLMDIKRALYAAEERGR